MAKAKKMTKTSKATNKDGLGVAAKVREAIKAAGCNTSGDAITGLNTWMHWLITQATARASANGRKTVRPHDFIIGN